jgi:hypothetical protein
MRNERIDPVGTHDLHEQPPAAAPESPPWGEQSFRILKERNGLGEGVIQISGHEGVIGARNISPGPTAPAFCAELSSGARADSL